jgi:Thioredoxin
MSSDDSSNAPRPGVRRDAVREKAQAVQARQLRARRIRIATIGAAVVAVVAITATVVAWIVSSAASQPQLSPSNAVDDGFVVTSVAGVALSSDVTQEATPTASPTASASPDEPEATPTERPVVDIQVYVDYLSTGSRDFQVSNVQQLAKWVGQDAATLTYHPVSMLTAKSNGTKYSLRSAGAAACVAQHSPDTFFAFNNALLTQQPDVDEGGYTDSELADLAIASGAENPKIVRTCIEEGAFRSWAKAATERALEGLPGTDLALTGTPTVLVNGKPYVGSLTDPKEFAQFVLTIASDAYYQATPTPTPTATP